MIDARWQGVKRILAVRLDNLGDVLLATPAIRALKQSFPGAEIALLASASGAQVGRLNPDVSEVIAFEAPWIDPMQRLAQDSARELAMVEHIRAGQFDAAVIFTSFRQSSLPAAYLCYLADIPLRLAYSIDGPGSLLTTRVRPGEAIVHEVERGLNLVAEIGAVNSAPDLILETTAAGEREADEWLAAHRIAPATLRTEPLVVVHPGCTMPARTAPAAQFSAIADAIAERLDAEIVVTGSAEERDLVSEVAHNVPAPHRAAIRATAGELSFDGFCALIGRADLVITNNTGPMHIAAAMKTPVISLFALTNPPEQWGPWRSPHRLLFHDVPCRLCYSKICPYQQECVRLVSTQTVVDAAAELLHGTAIREPIFAAANEALVRGAR